MIFTFSFQTIWLIIKEKPDIVHIHSPMFIFIALFAKLKKIRCYITYHGNEHSKIYNNKFLGTIFNYIFYKTFSLSSDILKYEKLYNKYKKNFLTIDNAVDNNIFLIKSLAGKRLF